MTWGERMKSHTRFQTALQLHRHDWNQDMRSLNPSFDSFTSEASDKWRVAWDITADDDRERYYNQSSLGKLLNQIGSTAALTDVVANSTVVPSSGNQSAIVSYSTQASILDCFPSHSLY